MKTNLLVAAALALTALATIPSAEASDMAPCQTVQPGCCPMSFAPCCTILSCPPVLHCPQAGTDSIAVAVAGPSYAVGDADVNTNSDCSVDACASASSSCSETNCDAGKATCCDIEAPSAACTCQTSKPTIPPVLPPLGVSPMMALPVTVGYAVQSDCSVTVDERVQCPAGFWEQTTYRDLGPVQVRAESCVVMCACMPIEVGVLE